MAPLSDCYSFAFERLKKNFAFYLVAGLVIVLIPAALGFLAQFAVGVVVGVMGASAKWHHDQIQLVSSLLSMPFSFAIGLVPLPFYASFFKALDAENSGSDAQPASIFAVGPYIVPSIIAGILSTLITLFGYILCIVPGLLVTPIFYMAMYHVARGESATGAISKSFSLLTSKPLAIAYWWGIFLPLGLLGLLICCVGTIVTAPMSLAAFYFMMRSLDGPNPAPSSPELPPLPSA